MRLTGLWNVAVWSVGHLRSQENDLLHEQKDWNSFKLNLVANYFTVLVLGNLPSAPIGQFLSLCWYFKGFSRILPTIPALGICIKWILWLKFCPVRTKTWPVLGDCTLLAACLHCILGTEEEQGCMWRVFCIGRMIQTELLWKHE